ncbi:hypothetical protein JRO89_XS07G0221400 [Xanthoceras sorbifolium]|uniref:Uncharacterized protein n=1 Tax=Xanthoceras sorbifolium TaxID=99658 RepID=A0ABQ8HUK6_9ROSI|nr:hypothetical protein JRO89_XS07G0221400 [Xanthoceras sorbifolium]
MDLIEGVGESSSPPRSFGSCSNYDVRNDVFNRLIENGNEEAVCNPEFREQLDAHFNRLPASYGLDVNMERVEDVLLHQKLLALAKDPEKRPVYHIRFVEKLCTRADGNDDEQFVNIIYTPRPSLDAGDEVVPSHKRDSAIDFEPCSKLEDLNLDVRKNSKDMGERYLTENFSRRLYALGPSGLSFLLILYMRTGKLAGKFDKRKMPDKEVVPSRKGKSVASKRSRRTLPKASMGPRFLRKVLGGADPSSAMPPFPREEVSLKRGVLNPSGGGVIRGRDLVVLPLSIDHRWVLKFYEITDPGAIGKMSNDDRIRIAIRQFYTAIGNFRHQEMRLVELHDQLEHNDAELIHKKNMLSCTQRDLGESREEVAHLKARVASLEKKAAKGVKAEEYRGRLKDARRLITRL